MAYYIPIMDYDIKVNGGAVPIGGSSKASFQTGHNSIAIKYKSTNYSLCCFKVMITSEDQDPEWGLHSGVKAFESLALTQINQWYDAPVTVNATNFPKGDGVYKILLCAQSDLDGSWDVTEILFTLSGVEFVTSDNKNVDLVIVETKPSE